MEKLLSWNNNIVNHLWYCCRTCDGSALTLKVSTCLYHTRIVNYTAQLEIFSGSKKGDFFENLFLNVSMKYCMMNHFQNIKIGKAVLHFHKFLAVWHSIVFTFIGWGFCPLSKNNRTSIYVYYNAVVGKLVNITSPHGRRT